MFIAVATREKSIGLTTAVAILENKRVRQ